MKLKELETPALVADLDALEQNIARMGQIMSSSKAKLRPHYKSHKCVEIAKMQIAAGAKGITCAKLSEAEGLIEAGIDDVLIANQVVQPSKVLRLAALAKKCRLTVCVDCEENVDAISQAAQMMGSTVHCYVEYDVGMNRCGVYSFEDFYRIAKHIMACKNLTFDGIQAYAGQLSHKDLQIRVPGVEQVERTLRELKAYLEERGIQVQQISGGSTGTVEMKAAHGIYTEIQAGSYLFSDTSYGRFGLPFQNALFVLSTVISKNPKTVVVDAGIKSFGVDQTPPYPVKNPSLQIKLHEEHCAIFQENSKLQIGEQVAFYPGHCCTTVNLYDYLYLARGEVVVDRIPVTGRGKNQ